MKKILLFTVLFVLLTGVLAAQDLIVLRDGNMIEAQILEISPTEIRYKRFNHLDGPTIIVPARDVLSMRYENGTVEVVNALPAPEQTVPRTGVSPQGNLDPSLGQPTILQELLNTLPAVTIAGNSLKFQFGGDSWVARLNGENFSRGTVEFAESAEGGTLTLRQTHIYPGAVGETAGRIAGLIPGGGRVGSALNVAGDVAGVLGPIEASGTIVLAFLSGPPASLRLVSSSDDSSPAPVSTEVKSASVRKNWVSAEIAYFGVGIRYERMLGTKLSLGIIANFSGILPSWNSGFLYYSYEIDSSFRWYPWGRIFFAGVGLGFNYSFSEETDDELYYYKPQGERYVLSFPLEIGAKIDLGNPGGFFIEPGLSLPLDTKVVRDFGWFNWKTYFVYFGMGGSF